VSAALLENGAAMPYRQARNDRHFPHRLAMRNDRRLPHCLCTSSPGATNMDRPLATINRLPFYLLPSDISHPIADPAAATESVWRPLSQRRFRPPRYFTVSGGRMLFPLPAACLLVIRHTERDDASRNVQRSF